MQHHQLFVKYLSQLAKCRQNLIPMLPTVCEGRKWSVRTYFLRTWSIRVRGAKIPEVLSEKSSNREVRAVPKEQRFPAAIQKAQQLNDHFISHPNHPRQPQVVWQASEWACDTSMVQFSAKISRNKWSDSLRMQQADKLPSSQGRCSRDGSKGVVQWLDWIPRKISVETLNVPTRKEIRNSHWMRR